MQKIINQSFEKMVSTYEQTLSTFYPAQESSGFTEANQVHIFINSLMNTLNDADAASWLEFPWVNKSEHIDGFVYSPKYRSVFYIEAKRLSHTKKKQEIINDIVRLYQASEEFLRKYDVIDVEHEYIIALSDIWLETEWKKEMPEWWCGIGNVPPQVQKWTQCKENDRVKSKGTLGDELYKLDIDWATYSTSAHWLGEKLDNVKNYCLLMASSKI